MKPRDVAELDSAAGEVKSWIGDLAQRRGWRDHPKAYAVLIGALHGLRDALPRDEVVFLGARLPVLLRGRYYEGWRPGAHPAAQSVAAICERIH